MVFDFVTFLLAIDFGILFMPCERIESWGIGRSTSWIESFNGTMHDVACVWWTKSSVRRIPDRPGVSTRASLLWSFLFVCGSSWDLTPSIEGLFSWLWDFRWLEICWYCSQHGHFVLVKLRKMHCKRFAVYICLDGLVILASLVRREDCFRRCMEEIRFLPWTYSS